MHNSPYHNIEKLVRILDPSHKLVVKRSVRASWNSLPRWDI